MRIIRLSPCRLSRYWWTLTVVKPYWVLLLRVNDEIVVYKRIGLLTGMTLYIYTAYDEVRFRKLLSNSE